MKNPILLLSLLLSSAAVGQNKTIRVMMLVCDTSIHVVHHEAGEIVGNTGEQTIINAETYNEYKTDKNVWWIRGYEVITKSQENTYDDTAALLSFWDPAHPGYKHLSYLDEKKKPLKYFVWLSKQIQ